MSTPITFNSVAYSVPQYNDTGYAQGPGNLSSYLIALSTGTLQPSGGNFTLTADVNFGTGFGLLAKYYTSVTANAADAGTVRLANTDLLEWRNFGLSGNNTLGVDSSDKLVYNGAVVQTGTGFVTSITGTANEVIASAATGAVTLSLPQAIATTSAVIFGSALINGPLSLSPASGNPRLVFDTTGGGVVTLDVPAAASTTFSLHLPSAQGAASSLLQNDGSGNLSWSTSSGFVSSITGTANQVIASASTGAVTLSLPQDIAASSSPTFHNLHLGSLGSIDNTANYLSITGAGGVKIIDNGGGGIILNGPSVLPAVANTTDLGSSGAPFKGVFLKNTLNLYGSSSGSVSIGAPVSPTTYGLNLPSAQGAANQTWINDGSGVMSFATLPVAGGGSGNTTFTAYSVICAGTTATGAFQNVSGLGSSGQVLTSNGPGLLPTWQTLAGTGTVNSGTSTHLAYYATSTNAVSDAASATISGAYTFSGALTSSGGLTMSGSTIAMGANKITGLANGTAATDAAAFGQIFGGFQAAVQSTNTTAFTTTSSAFQTTNCTGTITPTSSSHRIKITVTGTARTAVSANSCYVTIARGTTDLSGGNGFVQAVHTTATASEDPVAITYIDSPATTGATTYNVRIKNDDNTNTIGFGNGLTTVMILEEIV